MDRIAARLEPSLQIALTAFIKTAAGISLSIFDKRGFKLFNSLRIKLGDNGRTQKKLARPVQLQDALHRDVILPLKFTRVALQRLFQQGN